MTSRAAEGGHACVDRRRFAPWFHCRPVPSKGLSPAVSALESVLDKPQLLEGTIASIDDKGAVLPLSPGIK